jgi:hypothetical protein
LLKRSSVREFKHFTEVQEASAVIGVSFSVLLLVGYAQSNWAGAISWGVFLISSDIYEKLQDDCNYNTVLS